MMMKRRHSLPWIIRQFTFVVVINYCGLLLFSSASEVNEWQVTEECHEECVSNLVVQNNNGFNIRCNDSCKIDKCIVGCDIWVEAMQNNCQELCNGTFEELPVKALYCMMGCNFALNVYVKKIKDDIGIPSPPVLEAGSQTNVSVSLWWKGSINPNISYLVQWKYDVLPGEWEYYRPSQPLRQTACKVTHLHPYMKYKFRIAWLILPQFDPLISEESVVISTLSYGIPSSAPSVSLSVIDPTRILISWDPPFFHNGPILSYAVSLKNPANGHILVKDIPNQNAERFYLLGNLQPGTIYSVSVLARNSMGEGPARSVNITTPSRGQIQKNDGHPYLVLGARHHVIKQGIDMFDESVVLYQSPNNSVMIKGVALHIYNELMFVSDSSGAVLQVSLGKNLVPLTTVKSIIQSGKPSVLSVDWLNNKLYLVDDNKIARYDLDGKNYETVIVGLQSSPTDMKVDPYNGYLYWVLRTQTRGGLYKVDLADLHSGPCTLSDAKLIFTDDYLIAFAADFSSLQLLLPMETKNTVVAIALDGHEVTDIRQNTQQPQFRGVRSFVVHHGLLFWTTGDEVIGEEYQLAENKYYHNSYSVLIASKPYVGINILHPDAQPCPVPLNPVRQVEAVFDQDMARIGWSPPKLLRGLGSGAWQKWQYQLRVSDSMNNMVIDVANITTTSYTVHNLHENVSYYIKVRAYSRAGKGPWSEEFRGRTLRKGGDKGYPFMLWGSKDGILKSNMVATAIEPFLHRSAFYRSHVLDLAWYENFLFLITNSSQIYVYNMSSPDPPFRLEGIGSAHSLAVDWFGKKLYWSKPFQQVISRANFDGSQQEPLPIPTAPRELNVDSPGAYLYWTTWYSVECARLHGGDRQVYYQAAEFYAGKQVLGLTIDRDHKRVYWLVRSQEGGQLYRATMAGHTNNNLKATVQEMAILQEDIIRGPIRYHSDRLFWFHNQREALITDMSGRNVATLHGPGLSNLKSLTIVDPLQQLYPDGYTSDTLNVCPDQVIESSIKVIGSWKNFSLKWDPVTNVNYGQIFYEIKVDSDYDRNTVITQDTQFNYRKAHILPPFINMTVTIRSFTYWSSSRRVNKLTRSPMAVPSEPQHPRIFISHEKSSYNSTVPVISAELRWSPPERPNGIVLGYRVLCWKLIELHRIPICNVTLRQPKRLGYHISDLVPNNTYYFKVKAFTEVGVGEASHIVEARSSEETPIPLLLLTKAGAVEIADMDAHEERFVAMDTAEPVDVTYLSEDGKVFWIDRKVGLMQSFVNGDGRKKLYSLKYPGSSIAVDWVGRFLYWSEIDEKQHDSSIWKLDLNYQSQPKKIVESRGLIRTLRVNPFSNILLWTLDDSKNPGTLMISKCDGHDAYQLFDDARRKRRSSIKDGGGVCNCPFEVDVGQALSVDFNSPKQQDILWVDKNTGHIWATDMDGCHCKIVVNSTLVNSNVGLPPTSITVDKTHIYWSNASLHSIFSLEKPVTGHESPLATERNSVKAETVDGVHVITAMGSSLQPLPELRCLMPVDSQSPPMFESKTATSLTFQMEKVKFPVDCEDISKPSPYYLVYYRLAQENDTRNCSADNDLCQVVKSYNSTTTISSLLPYRHYAVQTTAGNHYKSHHSLLSPERLYMTKEGAPSVPLNVSCVVVSPDKVLVSWQPPQHLNGPMVHYYLYWASGTSTDSQYFPNPGFKRQGEQHVYPAEEGTQLEAILKTLEPAQKHFVSVRAYSAPMDTYTESDKIAVTTFPLPGNVTEEEVSSSHLLLKWVLPQESNIIEQILLCKEVYSSERLTPTLIRSIGTTNYFLLSPLTPKTRFSCRVHVTYCNIADYCNFTWPKDDRLSFETLGDKPGEPGMPYVTYLRKETYQVTWAPSTDNGGKTLYYSLEACVLDSGDDDTLSWHKIYNGTQWKWMVTGLNLNHKYAFRVMAANEYGNGNYSLTSSPFTFADVVANDEETHVILAVAGSVIAVLIVITLCILYRVCRTRTKTKLGLHESAYNGNGSMNLELATLQELPHNGNFVHQTNILYSIGNHVIDEELAALPQISRDQIVLTKFLGSGAFGEVFEGFARYLNEEDDEDRRVAIKTLRKGATDQEKTEFLKEAQLMSNFKHEHILCLLGICLDNDPNFIILELMEGGDLLSYLRSNRPTALETSSLTVQDLISICVDVAKGCKYLEEMHFVHRDLAARNCLVSSRNPALRVVKIGDFGLARDIYKNDYYRKEGEGLLPVRWMSPESLMDGVFTTQSDVWAFGVLLWEVMTLGQQPYPARTNLEVLHYVRARGRLDKPDNCPDDLHHLMLLCWDCNPNSRPTFVYCLDQLQELKRKSAELTHHVTNNNNYIGRSHTDGISNPGYSEETCAFASGSESFGALNSRLIADVSDRRSLDLRSHVQSGGDIQRPEVTVKRALSLDARSPSLHVSNSLNSSQGIPKYVEILGEELSQLPNDGYEIPIVIPAGRNGTTIDTASAHIVNNLNPFLTDVNNALVPKFGNTRHCGIDDATSTSQNIHDTGNRMSRLKTSWC